LFEIEKKRKEEKKKKEAFLELSSIVDTKTISESLVLIMILPINIVPHEASRKFELCMLCRNSKIMSDRLPAMFTNRLSMRASMPMSMPVSMS